MTSGDDPGHDAWLREALRHAPDAQLTAPASLSEMILREAQAKARSTAPPAAVPRPGVLAAIWDWLGRPPVAAGAASVMVAMVAGVIWWDRPIDADRGQPPLASVPAAAPEAAPSPPPATPPAPAPVAEPQPRAKAETKPAAALPAGRADKETRRRDAPLAQSSAAPRAFPAAPDEQQPAAASAERASAGAAAGSLADSATPAAAKAAPAAPAAPPIAPIAPPAPATAMAPLARQAPAAAQRERAEVASAEMRSAQNFAAPARFDVGALREALAGEPQRWTWQRGAAGPQPVNAALSRWLAQVEAAAAQGASAAGDQRDGLAVQRAAPLELQLWRDGRLAATLRISGTTLRWDSPASDNAPATRLQLRVDPATLQALERSAP